MARIEPRRDAQHRLLAVAASNAVRYARDGVPHDLFRTVARRTSIAADVAIPPPWRSSHLRIMSGVQNPHDRLFRKTLSRRETAVSFVREHLPEPVVRCIDLESLDVRPDSFVDSRLRGHFSDFVGRVRLRDGGDAYVYILIEHKTTPERLVAFQLLRYLTRLWHRHLLDGRGFPLPPVIPVVLYHGRRRWTPSTEFADLFQCPEDFQPFLPHFRYALTDLTRYTDNEVRGIELLVAPLLAMRHIYDSDLLERIPDILRELARVIDTAAGLDTLMALLEYFASTNRFGWHELEAAAQEAFPGPEGEEIMAIVTNPWVQKGLEQGLQQGLEQGLEQGMQRGAVAKAREDVIIVLETRFEGVPRPLRTRIGRLDDLALLSRLHRAALTATSLEDVERAIDTSRP